jgi:hypothetical protein
MSLLRGYSCVDKVNPYKGLRLCPTLTMKDSPPTTYKELLNDLES